MKTLSASIVLLTAIFAVAIMKTEREIDMNNNPKVVELQEIYREMDPEGKKKMVSAAAKLLTVQKTFFAGKSERRSFIGITGYLITGFLLLFVAYVFWVSLISPALLTLSDTPLTVVRIVLTALCGIFAIGTGFVWFLLKKLTIFRMLLAFGAGILCVEPGVITDFIGVILVVLIVSMQLILGKREKAALTI